jgi:hypothetical protein
MEVMAHCLVISVRTVHRAWTSGNFSVKYCVNTPGLVRVSHTSSYKAKRRLLCSEADAVTERVERVRERSGHRQREKENIEGNIERERENIEGNIERERKHRRKHRERERKHRE